MNTVYRAYFKGTYENKTIIETEDIQQLFKIIMREARTARQEKINFFVRLYKIVGDKESHLKDIIWHE